MIHMAERVEAVECAHSLEAEVRELRLIAAHKPPYNRRSKFPERTAWLKLTAEPYPRLSLVGAVRADGGAYLGPFSSRHVAELAAARGPRGAAAAPVHPVGCRPAARPRPARSPSSARCAAPCELRVSVEEYRQRRPPSRSRTSSPAPAPAPCGRRPAPGAHRQSRGVAVDTRTRHGSARGWPRCCGPRSGCSAWWRSRAWPRSSRPDRAAGGGWEIAVIRHGRLVAAGTSRAAASTRGRPSSAVSQRGDGPTRSGPDAVCQRRGDRAHPGLA